MQDMSWIHPKYHAGQGPVLTQWTSIILIMANIPTFKVITKEILGSFMDDQHSSTCIFMIMIFIIVVL